MQTESIAKKKAKFYPTLLFVGARNGQSVSRWNAFGCVWGGTSFFQLPPFPFLFLLSEFRIYSGRRILVSASSVNKM